MLFTYEAYPNDRWTYCAGQGLLSFSHEGSRNWPGAPARLYLSLCSEIVTTSMPDVAQAEPLHSTTSQFRVINTLLKNGPDL